MENLTLKEIAKKIKEKKKTLILCHKNPDSDTVGSAVALKKMMTYFGSEVDIGCTDEAPKRISFILDEQKILFEGNADEYERIVCVDVASNTQLGSLEELKDKVDFTIDHHAQNTRFSDYYEKFCSACAEIIYDLSKEIGIFDKMDEKFYVALYSGISGDTGCFKYSNVTPSTMRAGADIIEKGIDIAEINRLLFDCKTMGEIRAEQMTYEKANFYCENRLAIITVSNEMKKEYSVTNEDISDIVNNIRQIDNVYVAVSIKQTDNDEEKYTLSSRANCDIDISEVCAKIGGGGHKRAAGASLFAKSPREAEEMIVKLFSESVENYGK